MPDAVRTLPSGATIESNGVVTMPAGEYWVGDPCYGVPNEEWLPWLDAARENTGPGSTVLLAEIRGMPVLGINTEHGDGTYYDQNGYEYPVDAGMIGVVPAGVLDNSESVSNDRFGVGTGALMHLRNFPVPFMCRYIQPYGTITLGTTHIQTDFEDDECEDGEWDPEYDDDRERYYPQGEDQ